MRQEALEEKLLANIHLSGTTYAFWICSLFYKVTIKHRFGLDPLGGRYLVSDDFYLWRRGCK